MSVRTSPSRHTRRPLTLAVALALAALTQSALAASPLPHGFDHTGLYGNVGAPTTDPTGRTMTITQTSKGAVIQWDSFNIDQGYHVAFVQPGSDSVTLNRVTGTGGASQINGLLSAPGKVFVVNPSGVMFGASAQVNVGGLVASTLDISDANFISGVNSGSFAFKGDVVENGKGISNAGSISTSDSGTIAFLSADTVSNSGTLNAPAGTVALGWGRSLVLNVGGDGLTNLVISKGDSGQGVASIINSGTLQADGGQVVLRADLGDGGGVVNQSGIVRAHSLSSRGGVIVLDAGGNELDISGSNDASASDAGVAGGSITASADHLLVDGGAAFNAGGGSGGANGSLTINSLANVLIAGQDTLDQEKGNDPYFPGFSLLLDSSLGNALSKNTNVTVNALGDPTNFQPAYYGNIQMMSGSYNEGRDPQIAKTAGGDAQLTFNANHDILLTGYNSGTSISSSSGALNVNFDSDSNGATQSGGSPSLQGGRIEMDFSSIASNGGSVNFYGQGDPVNGRATGSSAYGSYDLTAIQLSQSTINTCVGGSACTGTGSISLRGLGADHVTQTSTDYVDGGNGIQLDGSTLTSSAGHIGLDGIGGTGGYGVLIDAYVAPPPGPNGAFDSSERGTPSLIQTQQGSITINGTVGNQATPPPGTTAPTVEGVGSGVSIVDGSSVLAGGDLAVTGSGGNLTPSLNIAIANGAYQNPSDGIDLVGANLQAGIGRTITLTGTAGSPGTGLDGNNAPPLPVAAIRTTEVPAYIDPNNPGNNLPAIASTLSTPGGSIRINGTGDLYFDNSSLSTQSFTASGGSIAVNAANILFGANAVLDASGNSGGGSINAQTSGVLAMDASATLHADANVSGNGGNITLSGTGGLRAYGALSAQGGNSSGNGGQIDTSGGLLDLIGTSINVSAAHGNAGNWLIDPYDVTIEAGTGPGTLPLNPFDPPTTSTITDGAISYALDHGSNVTITTGSSGTDDGNININSGINIQRTQGTAPVTFRLDANAGITSYSNFTIQSTAGPLNIQFDADATGAAPYQGIALSGAQLLTNGGNIAMFGHNDPLNGYADATIDGISINYSTLDTRVGQSDANAGGTVSLRGKGGYYGGGEGVLFSNSSIHTATGDIDIVGLGSNGGSGVAFYANITGLGQIISTTSGQLAITGIGSTGGTINTNSTQNGLIATNYLLQTGSGDIDLRGHGATDLGNGAPANTGIQLDSQTTVNSRSGNIYLSGSSDGSGAGVSLVSTDTDNNGQPYPVATVNSGSGTIVVRAHNNGSTDALVLDGTLTSTGTIDLRPGGVDANGNLTENTGDAIALGGVLGFGISTTELAHITANDLVLGSDIQAGAISASVPVTYDHNLTLDSGAGGGIAVNGALNIGTHTLALTSAGDITQTAPITAASLLAQSSAGSVNLADAGNNVSSATLAGSASGDFTFINAGTVGIGNVSAIGFNAAGNTPTTLTGNGIASGGNVLVRAMNGDMLLGADVSGSNVDLVSSGIFDNTNGSTITAAGNWRVWGNTWLGETRSGLAGSGNLPNLYGCSFGTACTSGIGVPTTDDHFIYTQRPVVTIDVNNAIREYGLPDGSFGYAVNGMILGDQVGNAITGGTTTAATQASHIGNYAITGDFSSPAGYAVNLVAGTLAITPATLTYTANPFSRLYGDPNGTFSGSVSGFRNGDTLASSTTGALTFTSPVTPGSNVGKYAINGGGLGAGDYVFVQAPGNATALTINPATLTFVADPYQRMLGLPNGNLTGDVTGLRNGDTLTSATTGILAFQSTAGVNSPTGIYAINGVGLQSNNYVFAQAPGNATALTITAPPAMYTLDIVRDIPMTYVYDRNFGIVGLCPAIDLTSDSRDKDGDTLAREWSRVRSRPNLANCVSTKQKNRCGDF